MLKFSIFSAAILLALAPGLLQAQDSSSTGSIVGSADPGAQIILTGNDSGSVIGIMATCEGTYKAENLKPGRYSIVEGGPHHAVRKLSVEAGGVSHVDLGAASADSTRKCNAKD
ncbi:carboxypeptidase-like regulatory domain-containing protein [Granulicella mallensis]|uniref:TonB-dependent outer membrane receptor n=1 Tax=Granulicella mallensis (strain ATCC BAA-1857 / DSM 23137 / MP5ACTX8) TaxID=682795 RepID=G8NVK7_GRAMM|nr:carboxypeptidase-like regulatory domain-containing protein [Granulicella mallensis]AEU37679.1 TonB-dependent outer membrane receptor precursor [Granulicella mallensis MP5ACTX8]